MIIYIYLASFTIFTSSYCCGLLQRDMVQDHDESAVRRVCPVRGCPGPAQPDDFQQWIEHERQHQQAPVSGLTCNLCNVVASFASQADLEQHRVQAHANNPQYHLAAW